MIKAYPYGTGRSTVPTKGSQQAQGDYLRAGPQVERKNISSDAP
jgi:hypothetical protein